MKYLCLVCCDEKTLDAMPKEEFEPFSAAHIALDEDSAAAAPIAGAAAGPHGRDRAVRRKVSTTDGPFAETKRQPADLPDRNQGPERRHPDRRVFPGQLGGTRCARSGTAPARAEVGATER
jgi:hypothetical protein